MDEQGCIVNDLYRALGLPAGGEFSSEDVSVIYREVFHYPSTAGDVRAAMKKVAGGDEGWSCVGESVLGVLLEMQRERERKDELYWAQQLQNMGKHRDGYLKDTQEPAYQQTECNQWRALRLKRSARQCWARLVTEGVHSIAPGQWRVTEPEVRGHALGCLTPADLVSLLEVKYEVVTGLLYAEMLRQHHGLRAWETLLPWQQDKEKEVLEDRAELALTSGDSFRVTELPGAFRIYKTREQLFPTGSSEPSAQSSWSAMTVLTEAYACRQQEMDSLTHLSQRLDGEDLKLLFLYIRLATFRAQTEHGSYGALLAARQLWESWPCVSDMCREEMVTQWLRGDEEETEKEICISASPQQAVLQWLVLKQKAERRFLLGLLHEVSLDQLEGQEDQRPSNDKEKQRRAALKDGCLRRLQQIRGGLRTRAPPAGLSGGPPQTQTAAQIQRRRDQEQEEEEEAEAEAGRPAPRWADCAARLLRQLTDAQEAQTSAVLPSLLHMSFEHLQALRDQYWLEFREQHFANLLDLLGADVPESSAVEVGSGAAPAPGRTGPIAEQNGNGGLRDQSATGPAEEPGAARAVQDVLPRQDLCTGCGAALEELPYLEVLCVSDTAGEEGSREEEEEDEEEEEEERGRGDGPRRTPQGYEKQGSLITLAWSKPTPCEPAAAECRVDVDVDAAGEDHRTVGQTCDEVAAPDTVSHVEVVVETPLAQPAVQPETTVEMHSSKQQAEAEPSPSEAHGFATEDPDIQQHFQPEAEECCVQSMAEPWAHKEHDLLPAEGRASRVAQSTEVGFPENETSTDAGSRPRDKTQASVSLLEREKTMRSLVDMQRKVELKQQRDRDRQLLRVQERLSIIQNKKAEEDLLGLKRRETLEHLTHNLPQEDKTQQKTVVRARLEQLRRERSCVMQSKRDRNTAGFKELLAPVVHSTDTESSTD